MSKDRDGSKDNKHRKKKKRHDNTTESKNEEIKDDIDSTESDNETEDTKDGSKGKIGDNESSSSGPSKQGSGKKKMSPEDLKKKKEEILRKKIALAKQFDDFKLGVYKQTGLNEISFLEALQELENESTIKPEATLSRVRVFLQEINQIRQELARLDTNLAGAIYYENEVFPLLNSLFFLAGMAGDLSLVARNLIQVSLAKNSKIEDAIALTYRMVRLSDRVFSLLEIKIYKLIRILSVNE